MRKWVLVIGTVFGGGIVLFLLLSTPEPTYRGRTITAWQEDWAARRNRIWPEAVKHIGTNALPYAIRNLARNDSFWRGKYARLQPKLPGFFQRIFPKPGPLLQEVDGANLFICIGTNSIPYAIALLKHKSPTVRRAAAWSFAGLRFLSPAAEQGIPALISTLHDPDRLVRFDAALSLEEMGPAASGAVPSLTQMVAYVGTGAESNNLFPVRAVAAVALGKIGPAASNALPTLRAALHESNAYLRGQSAVAVWRISGDVDSTLPVLLQEMPSTDQEHKWDWIIALGEMGPQAKAAIPQLQAELNQNRRYLNLVTNAFRRISPEAAAQAGIGDDRM